VHGPNWSEAKLAFLGALARRRHKGYAAKQSCMRAGSRRATSPELAIYRGGVHGFTLLPNGFSKSATARMMNIFLNRVLG
jgi:hypothetical protein